MAPPSVGPNVDTHGHRVFYGPPAMQREPWAMMPDDLPRVCSHYYCKVVCDYGKSHWPADQPYIKYKQPKIWCGNSCNCPKEPGDPDMPAKRTAYVRPHASGSTDTSLTRAQAFGANLAWIPNADCRTCQERKKKARDDSAAKRREGGGEGGGGSAGSKRKEGSDSKDEQKAKERRKEDRSGRMRWDPVRD